MIILLSICNKFLSVQKNADISASKIYLKTENTLANVLLVGERKVEHSNQHSFYITENFFFSHVSISQ